MAAESQRNPNMLESAGSDTCVLAAYVTFTACVLLTFLRRHQHRRAMNVPPPPPTSFATWMTMSPDELRQLPLNQVVFPGSHNSGTYDIGGNLVSGDCDAKLVPYVQQHRVVSSFVARWAACQRLSITQQLHAGVRYLDLRVQGFPNGDFRLCHSLCCISLHDCLTQVRAFLDAYPHELVLLDLNHIYVSDPAQFVQLARQVVEQLGRACIATRADTPATSTLASLSQNRIQAVVIFHHEPTAELLDVWGPNHIRAPWPNVASAAKVLQYADASLLARDLAVDQMYVTQLVATARPLDLVCHLNVLNFAKSLLVRAVPWLQQLAQQRNARTTACNIVMVDDCGTHQYKLIEAILSLNKTKAGHVGPKK